MSRDNDTLVLQVPTDGTPKSLAALLDRLDRHAVPVERVTVQTAGSSPIQSPLHSPNSLAASGVAVSETLEPAGKAWEQLLVHVMPAGVVLTLPPPGPATVVDSGYPNIAVTVLLPSVVTEQVGEDPEHAPPQERKTAPGSGFAVSVTIAEGSNNDAQVAPSPHASRPVMSVTEPPAPG